MPCVDWHGAEAAEMHQGCGAVAAAVAAARMHQGCNAKAGQCRGVSWVGWRAWAAWVSWCHGLANIMGQLVLWVA